MIIAVSNQKGGCGKTTTAVNLAASLAFLGHRTLLVDLDPQTHASYALGVKTDRLEASAYNVLTSRPEKKQFFESVIEPADENFDLAPGHVLLSTIEQEFADRDNAIGRLKEALDQVAFPYRYVVIDCPPSLGFLTFNALHAAALVIVPVDLGSFSLLGVGKLMSMIELIRVRMNHTPHVLALATMVDLRSVFSKRMIEQIRETFAQNFFDTLIRLNVACREAQARGVPVLRHKPEARASADYLALAREIAERFPPDKEPEPAEARPAGWRRSRVRDFEISAPAAHIVYLVGDFNGWRIDEESRLRPGGRGVWQKRLALSPGRHRYKFVIDGAWIPDPANAVAEPNPYGGVDSILEVE